MEFVTAVFVTFAAMTMCQAVPTAEAAGALGLAAFLPKSFVDHLAHVTPAQIGELVLGPHAKETVIRRVRVSVQGAAHAAARAVGNRIAFRQQHHQQQSVRAAEHDNAILFFVFAFVFVAWWHSYKKRTGTQSVKSAASSAARSVRAKVGSAAQSARSKTRGFCPWGTSRQDSTTTATAPAVGSSRPQRPPRPARPSSARPSAAVAPGTTEDNDAGGSSGKVSKKKALVIGINYTGTSSALSGCINDAHNIVAALRTYEHLASRDIRVLTDDTMVKPTRRNILAAIDWLVKDASPGDALFLHYSGHGSHVRDTSGDERDGQDETIVPIDFQMITDDELWLRLVRPLNNTGAKLTALFDNCHSGTGVDLPFEYIVSHDNKTVTQRVAPAGNGRFSSADVIFFSGCADHQTSSDVSAAGGAYGAFTNAFLGALRRTARRSRVTYKEFLLQVNRSLDKSGFRQQPQMGSSSELSMGQRFELM